MFANAPLAQSDPELWNAILLEHQRQEDHIELIASENYVSPAVLEAQGSQLTNKYAEGYPGKRYYGGCDFVDIAEHLAIERAKTLVRRGVRQRAAALGLAGQPGRLPRLPQAGRHDARHVARARRAPHARLAAVNSSGKLYRALSYGLDANEVLDYDEVERLARENKPRIIIAGASAYALRDRLGAACVTSRTRSTRCWSRTWRTTPGWSRRGCTRARSASPTSSPPPRTRRCADRAAA